MEHRREVDLPEQWKERIRGKKVIFYNTSITAMLRGLEKHIDKIDKVFDVFKRYPKVVLWWRPHPLERSTVESMHPELIIRYQELRERFVREDIGILDESADLYRAIAVSDAYFGDESSVLTLYEKTGKPILMQTDDVLDEKCERNVFFSIRDYCIYQNSVFFITGAYNLIFEMDKESFKIKNIVEIAREYPTVGCLKQIESEGEEIIVRLQERDYFVKYHVGDERLEYVDNIYYDKEACDADKIFWTASGVGYTVAGEDNKVYEIEREKSKHSIYNGKAGDHFWGVVRVDEKLIIPHSDKMIISVWDMNAEERMIIDEFPEEFEIFGSNPYAAMIVHQRDVYLFPAASNMVLKINLERLCVTEALVNIRNDVNPAFSMYMCVKKRGNIVSAVYNRKNMWHIINLDTGEVTARSIQIDDELKEYIIDRPIFQIESRTEATHSRMLREDQWYNTLPRFIKSIMRYQIPCLELNRAAMEESIGKKIYEATKEVSS